MKCEIHDNRDTSKLCSCSEIVEDLRRILDVARRLVESAESVQFDSGHSRYGVMMIVASDLEDVLDGRMT